MLPDLLRFYPALGGDEHALLSRPWRDLYDVILTLFGIRESLTGATWARAHTKEDS